MDNDSSNRISESKQQIAQSPLYKVFNNELLREKILDYVIHDRSKVLIPNAAHCRLVRKAWLQSVSRVLSKRQEPFLQLSLPDERFIWLDFGVAKSDNKIDKFVGDISGASFVGDRTPPFAISASFGYFEPENIPSFSNLLTYFGGSLVELTLLLDGYNDIPIPISINFSGVLLSKLRLFKVDLSNTEQIKEHMLVLAQQVLDATKQLKSFILISVVHNNVKSLVLPSSVIEVTLDCPVNNQQLEILAETSLPSLKTLKLRVNQSAFKAGLVTRVMKNVRKTLDFFSVREPDWDYMPNSEIKASTFQLPLMEKLKRMEIYTKYLVLERPCSSLESFVPKLGHLTLAEQTPSTFRTWTENSCLTSVHSLSIAFEGREDPSSVVITLATMHALKCAFPNVCKLDISLSEAETPVLQFIMTEMRQMQQLKICLDPLPCPDSSMGADLWDTIFVGIEGYASALKKYRRFEYRSMLTVCKSSIRNLTELHTLELCTLSIENVPLLSDATFYLAFLKMPKLKNLILKGDFYARKNTERKWLSMGRNIENRAVDRDTLSTSFPSNYYG